MRDGQQPGADLVTAANDGRLDTELVAALYHQHGEQLRRFLLGVLGDPHLAQDATQAAFAKLSEQGHLAHASSRKSWLFRVGYREALVIRRREKVAQRALRQIAEDGRHQAGSQPSAQQQAMWQEQVARLRQLLVQLPADQAQVVRMRIYEQKTFAAIAGELNIPLGTALGRMRNALAKLRKQLDEEQ